MDVYHSFFGVAELGYEIIGAIPPWLPLPLPPTGTGARGGRHGGTAPTGKSYFHSAIFFHPSWEKYHFQPN
jgi:hypothetical protein